MALEVQGRRPRAKGKLYPTVDGHPAHRSVAAKRFMADIADGLRLIRLPACCPGLDPDELLNRDTKTNTLGKRRPTNQTEMIATCVAIGIVARSGRE